MLPANATMPLLSDWLIGWALILRVNGFVPPFVKAGRGPSNRLTKRGPTRLRRRARHHGLSNLDQLGRCAPRVAASKCELLDLFDTGKGLDLVKNRVQKDAIDLDERDRRAALAITAKGEGRDIDFGIARNARESADEARPVFVADINHRRCHERIDLDLIDRNDARLTVLQG
jgi:hypothetical protein